MPPNHEEMLRETYRLAFENNRLLRKMRRASIWGRIITLVFYAVVFLGPIWFYLTYLNTSVQQLLKDYQGMQGTGQQAQGQFQAMQDAFKQFESKFQSPGSSSTSQ